MIGLELRHTVPAFFGRHLRRNAHLPQLGNPRRAGQESTNSKDVLPRVRDGFPWLRWCLADFFVCLRPMKTPLDSPEWPPRTIKATNLVNDGALLATTVVFSISLITTHPLGPFTHYGARTVSRSVYDLHNQPPPPAVIQNPVQESDQPLVSDRSGCPWHFARWTTPVTPNGRKSHLSDHNASMTSSVNVKGPSGIQVYLQPQPSGSHSRTPYPSRTPSQGKKGRHGAPAQRLLRARLTKDLPIGTVSDDATRKLHSVHLVLSFQLSIDFPISWLCLVSSLERLN